MFHGPAYASPARFLEQHRAGVCCASLEPAEIIRQLEYLVSDSILCSELAFNGHVAFKKYFTLKSLRRSFSEFLHVSEDVLLEDGVLRGCAPATSVR